jgi:cbb3-type cytochrome oxidase maturation protein
MNVILILIPVSVLVAAGFLAAFIWAVRSGQYEDTCTPSMRMLTDDAPAQEPEKLSTEEDLNRMNPGANE